MKNEDSKILTVAPKKLWSGKKRICKKSIRPNWSILQWALTIKVGDYIGTCEGYNRKVSKIEYIWKKCDQKVHVDNRKRMRVPCSKRNWYLNEVIFYDTNGRMHHCPGGGCAFPAKCVEQILSYYKENWPEVSPPKLDEFGEIIFSPEERIAWNEEWKLKYPF